jgi:hypothetical protein
MLVWHRQLYLIDHGAALYFHHSWDDYLERSRDPFLRIKDHVLLPAASAITTIDADMAARLSAEVIADIVALIPDAWLDHGAPFVNVVEQREAYLAYLTRRLAAPRTFVMEAVRAGNV